MLKLATKFTPEQGDSFALATSVGFQNAEFWLDGDLLLQWEAIVQLASGYEMGYALHFPNRGELEDAHLTAAVQMFQELDCSALVIHKPMAKKYGDRLREFDPQLRLAVENHRLTRGEFEKWANKNAFLTLDVEHLWKYTVDDGSLDELLDVVEDFLARFGEKLAHVHLPGYVPGYEEHRPMYCSREMVFAVLNLLNDHQFEGLIVGETHPKYQCAEDLRMDVLLYQRWQELHLKETVAAATVA